VKGQTTVNKEDDPLFKQGKEKDEQLISEWANACKREKKHGHDERAIPG